MSAVNKLVGEIVDYAGLFPPAKLPLAKVAENFATYLSGEFSWMLARLVVPASQLAELENQAALVASERTWKISALLPSVNEPGFDSAIASIASFNQRMQDKAVVDNVEIKAPTANIVEQTVELIPPHVDAFLEIPHIQNPTVAIEKLAAADNKNLFAKIRTGGVTSDLIPTAQQVARFISVCAQNHVGMKATAGLHHPLRGNYRLTYEDDADSGVMFGFFNVFLAGCFAYSGDHDPNWIQQLLVEEDANCFIIEPKFIEYAGKQISTEQIQEIRCTKMMTFGSCSFTEPTTELRQIGWLQEINN